MGKSGVFEGKKVGFGAVCEERCGILGGNVEFGCFVKENTEHWGEKVGFGGSLGGKSGF